MKKLLFLFLLIFSSQSFAKSPAGKVLFCQHEQKFELSYGFVFLDELQVEIISVKNQKINSHRAQYKTSVRKISVIILDKYPHKMSIEINRKTLIAAVITQYEEHDWRSIRKCSVQTSKRQVIDYMRSTLNEILNSNQI